VDNVYNHWELGGIIIIWLETETWVTGKGSTKMEGRMYWVGGGRGLEAAGFCGPCVCLVVFLLLYWRVLLSGIAGAWGCV
jgi:hypothetical protein